VDNTSWSQVLLNAAETSRNLHGFLKGKPLYSALYGVYVEVLQDLKAVVLQESTGTGNTESQTKEKDNIEFREQRRRSGNPSDEATKKIKISIPTAGIKDPRLRQQHTVTTRNFFASLRTTAMECEGGKTQDTEDEVQQGPTNKTGRSPPIVLTSPENLIAMQKKLKGLCRGDFEFRSTRNGTRILTKKMADYSAIRSHLDSSKLPYFTFFPKSQKPIKAVIRHLPHNTPAEDISDGLVNICFNVISVKQMTTIRRSATEEPSSTNLPLFLITLPRTPKSQDIFQLRSLCHIAIKVEAYKAQSGLTQCYNCQKFGPCLG
jgi:hypothetical protein